MVCFPPPWTHCLLEGTALPQAGLALGTESTQLSLLCSHSARPPEPLVGVLLLQVKSRACCPQEGTAPLPGVSVSHVWPPVPPGGACSHPKLQLSLGLHWKLICPWDLSQSAKVTAEPKLSQPLQGAAVVLPPELQDGTW